MLMDEVKAGPSALVGTLVDGKYRLEEHLGDGGMGSVYRACHVSLGAARAIKMMRRELADDPGFVARFQKEARIAARLRHPHLVALYDFAQQADGTWYSVSELVVGETLAARLARGVRFTGEDVARLLGQVADGLAAAHAEGIVHRDISPDNIIVTRDENGGELAKLLDFGIAKDTASAGDGTTGAGLLLGKVGYASPEQMGLLPKGEAIDARTDVFSLAAVAYLLLSGGRLPWPRETPRAYIHDLLVRPEDEIHAAIERDLPVEWRGAVAGGLARRRAARTPTVQALKEAFVDAARRGEGGPEPDDAARTRPLGARARPRATMAPIVMALFVALGVVTIVVMRRERLPPEPSASSTPSRPASIDAPAPVAETDTSPHDAPPVKPAPKTSVPTAAAAPATPVSVGPAIEAASAPASLSVTADAWMLVSIDGGAAEQTPFRFERLSAGRHVIEARRDGYKDIRREVEIRAGEAQHLALAPERVVP
jgi:serine/threonine-protein kinase